MKPSRPSHREQFHVAIVCALPLEFDAALSQLDEIWDDDHTNSAFGKTSNDLNTYVNGRIWQHNVVLVLLPNRMGKVNAAVVASDLRHSYPNVRVTLLVGICGGVPKSGDGEILLGDVVISRSLVQYDFGREYPDGFRRKNSAKDNLTGPNHEIQGILAMLDTEFKNRMHERAMSFLRNLQQRNPKYAFPGTAHDRLFQPEYRHKHQGSPDCECRGHVNEFDTVCEKAMECSCEEVGCEDGFLVQRSRLNQRMAEVDNDSVFDPAIHVGPVGSGDTVMKSAIRRDKVAEKEGIIAFEMEAAGIWEHQPCLVVKGVCDYADSHKNKKFQDYAAATAASVAKALLKLYTPAEKLEPTAVNVTAPKWNVPFPQDPDFVDQSEISAWLKDKFKLQGARIALLGLGGIGKSQLAIQFAYTVRSKSHVFWVNASSRSTLEHSYRSMAHKLDLDTANDSFDNISRRVSDWLSDEQNGRWTVVLDNFDDHTILTNDDPRLTQLLPPANNGFALITSRTQTAVEKLIGNNKNIYQVEAMSGEVATELFQSKLKKPCGKEEAQEVVRLLDHMPLAISHAAAYVNRLSSRVSVSEYAEKLRSNDTQSKLLDWKHDDDRRYHGTSTSILGTWTVTFDQIQQERPSAAHLLSLMSFFSPQSIPGWALKAWYESDPSELPYSTARDTLPSYASTLLSSVSVGRRYLSRPMKKNQRSQAWGRWAGADLGKGETPPTKPKKARFSSISKVLAKDWWSAKSDTGSVSDVASTVTLGPGDEFERDLETLLGYSLVLPTASEGVFKMHSLVRYCTQAWLARSGNIGVWKKRFMLAATINIDAFAARDRLQQGLTIHFDPLAEEEPEDAPTARLWFGLAWSIYHTWQRNGVESTPLMNKMLAVGDRLLGPADRFTLNCMDLKARSLRSKKEYANAEAVYKDILERAEMAKQQNCYVVQESRLAYARMLSDIGRLEDSEGLTRGIVKDRMRILGPQDVDTLWTLGNHASVLTKMGRFEEACDIIKQLLQEDWTEKEEFAQELTLNSVASAALSMGTHNPAKEVEPLLREMTDFVEGNPKTCSWFPHVIQGPFHYALAECLKNQGKKKEAVQTYNLGIELMANLIPIPSLQPPTLLEDFLDERDDNEERRGKLLQSVIENLHGENAQLGDAFYWGMVNIGRRLSMQCRDDEALKLLDAIHNHLSNHSAYGSTDKVTKRVRIFWEHIQESVSDKRQENGEAESRRQSVSVDSCAETLQELSLS
jgi:nucleoside phosphorylase/tetratricopeptide (TPR) repeat protein